MIHSLRSIYVYDVHNLSILLLLLCTAAVKMLADLCVDQSISIEYNKIQKYSSSSLLFVSTSYFVQYVYMIYKKAWSGR